VIGQREVQQQISVLADNIHQQIDHFLGRLVSLAALVMPLANAGVGLPRIRRDAV